MASLVQLFLPQDSVYVFQGAYTESRDGKKIPLWNFVGW